MSKEEDRVEPAMLLISLAAIGALFGFILVNPELRIRMRQQLGRALDTSEAMIEMVNELLGKAVSRTGSQDKDNPTETARRLWERISVERDAGKSRDLTADNVGGARQYD